MAAPTVVLFDIDGTLVLTGGAGRRAMRRAFDDVVGRSDMLESFSFGGMTDYLIVRTAVELAAAEWNEAARDAILEAYLVHLADELPRAHQYEVMPGVVGVLEGLADKQRVAIGLGTGNIERGARLKLERGGLNRYFGFGGFGCDAEDRGELLRRGAERGAVKLDARIGDCRVIVIGDTPRDVHAAHAIGARCIAVGTGGDAIDDLRAAGADEVFENLSAPTVLDAILTPR